MPVLEYQKGESLMHKLSPIAKFIWGGIVVMWLFVTFNPLHVFALGVAILLIAKFAAQLSLIKILRTTLLVGVAGISILLFQTFLYQGGTTVLFRVGPLVATYEGFSIGLAIALRVLGIVAASTIIAKTTHPRDIFLAMVKVGVPYRIAYGLFTAIRFIPLLEYEASIILDAQHVRGIAVKKGGLINRFRRLVMFLIPLVATAMRRATQSALAMEVRAFGLHPTRTYTEELEIPRWESAFIAGWIALFVLYAVFVQGDLLSAVFYNPPTIEPWEKP